MTVTGDILRLLLLIQSWSQQIDKISALILKMQAEGRDKLTLEELAELKSDDDEAREELVDAING
jgi:hypothetical protein